MNSPQALPKPSGLLSASGRAIKARVSSSAAKSALVAAGLSPLMALLFANRNIPAAELNLDPALLPDCYALVGTREAAALIVEAIVNKNTITVVGDYDADGATSTAIFLRALRKVGADIGYLVPDRRHGYGLSAVLSERAFELGTALLITVDNGIAAIEGVAKAKELGMTVLVTDHHLRGERLPNADVIVNPTLPGTLSPSPNLAGVGVAFYVLAAVRKELITRGLEAFNLLELSDLVAIGTVGDMVKLDHVNRILVDIGIRRIRAGKACIGIAALLSVAKKRYTDISTELIGFQLAPRINAAGRLETADASIALLVSDDKGEAIRLAADLEEINIARKQVQRDMTEYAAFIAAAGNQRGSVVVIQDVSFNEGVVGLVASKLKDTYGKPAAVFATAEDGNLKGSFRSIPGVHVRDALALVAARAPGVILRFGGHALAAGCGIIANKLTQFKQEFNRAVEELALPGCFDIALETDGELEGSLLTIETADDLAKEHWGSGIPSPLFEGEFIVLKQTPLGKEGLHLKLMLELDGNHVPAVYFNFNGELPETVRLVYRPTVNEWNGERDLQLIIETHAVE